MKTKMKVPFYIHNVNEEDIERCSQCLEQPFLATGSTVEEFELQLAKFLAAKYVVGVNSCTAALHMGLLAAGVKRVNEVITTPLTYVATPNVIEYIGAKPIFVDVHWSSGLMNEGDVLRAMTHKTKAILPVHLYGEYSDIRVLKLLGIPVIEDAAHALETVGVGVHGDFACFSFYPVKSITCGDGGAISCWNKEEADKLKQLRMFGVTKPAWKRYEKKYSHWDMDMLGYKYTMTNVDASLLLGQLSRIKDILGKRRLIHNQYRRLLEDVKGIRLLDTTGGASKLMFPIVVKDTKKRDKVIWGLEEREIGIGVHFNPVHLNTYYRKKYGYKEHDFPIAEEIGYGEISLPIYPKMTEDQVNYVVDCIKEVIKEV